MNTASAPICLKQDSSASELAALATIGLHYGLPLTLPSIRKLTGFGKQSLDGVQLLAAAARCGLQALPLEGEFDQLPEVQLPCIVTFGEAQYQVLFGVDADSALVGNTATGEVKKITRAEFCENWTGDVFQLQPNDDLPATRETLRRLCSPWWIFCASVGAAPFSFGRILFAVALCAWVSGLLWAPTLALLTGACLLVSLWMAGWPRGCSRCGTASLLAGALPLPWLGTGFYAAITAAVLLDSPQLYGPCLLAAAGAHLGLATILLRHRSACYPCLGLAATGWLAAGLVWLHHPPVIEMLLLPASFVIALFVLIYAAKLAAFELEHALLTLAASVAAGEIAVGAGRARLVVYGRNGCPNCLFFKNIILPSLVDAFGDALEVEQRDAGNLNVAVPLFCVTAAARIVLTAVPTEEMLQALCAAIEAAMDPAAGQVGQLGGFQLVGMPVGR